MLYQKSLDIEQRLRTVLDLIGTGEYSTPELAKKVGVSIPTISRDVTALRQRGHLISAQRHDGAWHFVIVAREQNNEKKRRKRATRKPR